MYYLLRGHKKRKTIPHEKATLYIFEHENILGMIALGKVGKKGQEDSVKNLGAVHFHYKDGQNIERIKIDPDGIIRVV